jgi:hypothetical protein
MQNAVKAAEWEHSRQQSNTPLHPFIRPPTQAKTIRCEHEFGGADRSLYRQNHDPRDEEGDVRERADDLDRRQQSPREDVDEDGDCEDRPGEEGSVPAFVDVGVIIEDDEALDDGAEEEGWLGTGCNPGKDLCVWISFQTIDF